MATTSMRPATPQNVTVPTTAVPYSWNEEAEIEYVLMEEDASGASFSKSGDLVHRMMHGRLLNKQIRRARHIPTLLYAPAVLVGW